MARRVMLDDGTEARAFGRDGLYLPEGRDARYTRGDGIAWYVLGRVIEPEEVYDDDGEPLGFDYVPTGQLAVCMVGDDQVHVCDEDDLTEIDEESYCPVCGQIGCGHGR